MSNNTANPPRELLERLANAPSIRAHGHALDELRAFLAAPVLAVIPEHCTHGAYGDDAACMDCLKAWGQYPFAVPDALSTGFYTTESGGGKYAINISFGSMADMQVADQQLRDLLLGSRHARVAPPECKTCGGTRMVDDGELTCSAGGIPYEMGPIKCVKDCPDCKPFKAPGAEQRHAVPDGYCLMPTSLTAENGAKSLLIGEFKVSRELSCSECESTDEESDDCEICGGHGSYSQDTPIGWDLMKEIYHKAVEGLALKPEPSAPKCSTCQDNGVIGWTSGQTAESFDMGEYECPDCAPADQPQGGRAAPFNTLCYGAKFKYSKDEAAEWVKIGHNLIAGWKAESVSTSWVGQPLCSFADDDDFSAVVWLIDEGAGK